MNPGKRIAYSAFWPDLVQFSSFQSLSHVQHSVTPWTITHQASQSITNSWSLLKHMSIETVMPPSHLILCCPFLLLSSIFPSIRSFPVSLFFASGGQSSGASASGINEYSGFNEYSGLISFRIAWCDLPAVQGLSRVFSNTTVQKRQFFAAQLSL